MPAGKSVIVAGRAAPRGAYPHLRVAGGLVYVSGTSSRRADGSIAGLLGDRMLPFSSQRSRTHWLPFLGTPARFSDGPFRLAAMLRRQVIFMTGLYHGANRYELRFAPLFRQVALATRRMHFFSMRSHAKA